MRKIEICCGSVADVITARRGGAMRVELCTATELGGLTPSAGIIEGAVREKGDMQVHVLIRPRGGDFVYTPPEVSVMEADIIAAKQAGADGVVIGALTENGEIDMPAMQRLLEAARGMNVTFHRAFDEIAAPREALEQIIGMGGISRILTSGCKPSAPQGVELLAELVKQASGRIIIMPGAGITPANIAEMATVTRAEEFHSTATDKTAPSRVSTLFGARPMATSEEIVRALVNE